MKQLVIFLGFFLIAINCSANDRGYDHLTTIRNESGKFIDSLINSGVDTVYSYYKGSLGCPAIDPISVIYWQKNNVASVVIFRSISKFKKGKEYPKVDVSYFRNLAIMYAVQSDTFFDAIQNETHGDSIISNKPDFIYNQVFERFYFLCGKKFLDFTLTGSSKINESGSYRRLLMDDFLTYVLLRSL